MPRKASVLIMSGLFMLATAGHAEPKLLRVGVDLTNPPLQVRDQHGNPTGFVIDITNALCQAINAKCHYVVNSFDAQIPELLARKVDFIMPLGVTPKRRASIAFSRYVYHDPTVLVARKAVNLLPQVTRLQGKNIAVEQGSIQETWANTWWLPAGVVIKSYPDMASIYLDLVAGRLDGALCPAIALKFGFLHTVQGEAFEVKGSAVTDTHLFSIGSAYGIRKEDEATQRLINKGLEQIKRNGVWLAIKERYFGDLDISVAE
ncbi:ABC transporter substrate-binding protein [Salmonella enterica]|nr:ABC transporter substrate-binding protein [Salmonella enterica]EAX3522651.1 transporter substrate-binding domain-containing protein [Salmonella enterica]